MLPARAIVVGVGTVREMRGHTPSALSVKLGLIAHDACKDELCLFVRAHSTVLEGIRLIAPEDTARALEEIGAEVESLAPGTRGGDLQLAAAVVEGGVDAVIFLRDPFVALAGEPSIEPILRVCDLEKVPIATNLGAAEIFLQYLADAGRLTGEREEPLFPISRSAQVLRLTRHPSGGRRTRGRVKP